MSSVKRKILVLISTAVTMVAFGALASAAQAAVIQDTASGEPCTELTVEGNDVSGGCLIEDMEGEFTILTSGFIFNSFDANFDMRIDSLGNFYAINQTVEPHPGYARQQCTDPSTSESIPWSGTAIGGMKMTMCLAPPPGWYGGSQTVAFKNSFEPYGDGHVFLGMDQTDSTSSGIAWAEFDNGGAGHNEILIVAS